MGHHGGCRVVRFALDCAWMCCRFLEQLDAPTTLRGEYAWQEQRWSMCVNLVFCYLTLQVTLKPSPGTSYRIDHVSHSLPKQQTVCKQHEQNWRKKTRKPSRNAWRFRWSQEPLYEGLWAGVEHTPVQFSFKWEEILPQQQQQLHHQLHQQLLQLQHLINKENISYWISYFY